MKPTILFIMHMPPPVHGAAMMGKYIHDSKLINDTFDCIYINPSASSTVAEVGKLSLKKAFFLIKLIRNICSTIKKEKPDVCYYTPTADGWGIYRDALTIQCMKWMGAKKIILHMHNKGVAPFSHKFFSKIAYKKIFKGNKIILLAKELKEDVRLFINDNQIIYCPNGMPKTVQDENVLDIVKYRIPIEQKAKILYLSNMMSEKGIWTLLDAAKILKENNIDFHLQYVGNYGDTNYEEFTNKIKDFSLEKNVFVNGPKYGEEKTTFFQDANLFVFPTYYHGETFGLVLLEAMEYAIPCISTYEGGIPSIIEDGVNGLLCKQKDANDLAEKIMWMINNPVEARNMGYEGYERFMKHFTLKTFEENLKSILEKV